MPDEYTTTGNLQSLCEHEWDYIRKEGTSFLYRCMSCGKELWKEEKHVG